MQYYRFWLLLITICRQMEKCTDYCLTKTAQIATMLDEDRQRKINNENDPSCEELGCFK